MTPPRTNMRFGAPPGSVEIAGERVCVPVTPITAITLLRAGFTAYGFDVSAYADSAVSNAILAEAHPDLRSSHELYGRAFERLKSSSVEAA